MPRKTPHHIVARRYTTSTGEARTIYTVRFWDWQGIRRFFPGTDNLQTAITIRDFRLGQNAVRYDFDREKQQRKVSGNALGAWSERWLERKSHKHSHGKDRVSVERIRAFFGNVALAAITASRIEEYVNWRQTHLTRYGRPPMPATINRELAVLRSLLLAAVRDGLLEKAPRVALLAEHNQRQRTATEAEYLALCQTISPCCRGPLVLLWEVGMRLNEAVTLTRRQISFERAWIDLGKTKTGEPRRVPMNAAVLEILQPAAALAPQEPVFRAEDGQPLTRHIFTYRFLKACETLGIVGLWRHDLRSSFVTRKQREGWDREFIKRITGHRSDSAFDRYSRPTFDDLRRVVGDTAAPPQKPTADDPGTDNSVSP